MKRRGLKMGFCMKCGGPTEDDQTICENCRAAQQESESEATPAEEIKLVPIQELSEAQTPPEPTETVPAPEEKLRNTKTVKIMAIVASALVVLTGAFYVGRAFFARDIMQLVIGKSRYAQNLEQASAQMITKQLVASIDKSVSLTKAANQDRAMEMELSNKISIEDAFYNEMNLGSEGTAAAKQAVSYLNSLSFKDTAHTKAGNMQSLIALSDKAGTILNINTIMSADGKAYIQLPDISKKYFSAKSGASTQSMLNLVSNLKYDPDKLNASLKKIASAYSDAIGKAAVTAEDDQALTVDGVVVQGQKLTASLNAEQTAAMLKSVVETAKNDEYLYTVISENYPAIVSKLNELYGAGAEPDKLTKENYNQFFDNLISKSTADPAALSVSSYIARDGALLARSYTITNSAGVRQVNLLFPKNSLVISAVAPDKSTFICSRTTTGEGAGNIQIKFKNLEQPKNIGITIDYSGCKIGKFMGSDQLLGKFKISLYDPDDTLGKSLNSGSEVFKKLGSSTLTIQNTLNGADKLTTTMDLSLPGLASFSMNGKTTGKTGGEAIAVPSDAGQIIDMSSQNAEQEQKQYVADALKYVSGLMDGHSDFAAVLQNFGMTKEMISTYLQFYAS
jgi:hypothetical protein